MSSLSPEGHIPRPSLHSCIQQEPCHKQAALCTYCANRLCQHLALHCAARIVGVVGVYASFRELVGVCMRHLLRVFGFCNALEQDDV
jgi:hypothetical protein